MPIPFIESLTKEETQELLANCISILPVEDAIETITQALGEGDRERLADKIADMEDEEDGEES